MTSCDGKKALPPAELTPYDVANVTFQQEETRAGNLKQRKILIGVICVIAVLLLAGGTLLGLYLNQGSVVSRNLQIRSGDEVYYETVETDEDDGTDTFYTEGKSGVAAVMFDHKKSLKAYKFSGRKFCYIVPEEEGEEENAKEVAKHMENIQAGSTEEAKNGGRMKMSLDESRPDTPELSEAMEFFCGDLQPRWATISLPDGQDKTGGIVLIAPGSADASAREPKERVKRGWWGRRRRRRRRRGSWYVRCCWGIRYTWYF